MYFFFFEINKMNSLLYNELIVKYSEIGKKKSNK